jgi:hypothetical protein
MPIVAELPNTYWVRPGTLAAGEYPGHPDAGEAAARVGLLLDAGIDCFIDLTEPDDGLEPYEPVLRAAAAQRDRPDTAYLRLPIRDLRVPSRADMAAILDLIDAALASDRRVYVHCWGGVGRTGTVVGCHLVRHGLGGAAALRQVASLFGTMARAAGRTSPETHAQRRFVRDWTEPVPGAPASGHGAAPAASPAPAGPVRPAPRDTPIAGALAAVELGEATSFGGLSVLPLIAGTVEPRSYLTLAEARAEGTFEVAEVSAIGSVPELRATNRGDRPVLLIDGEELIGAKQNRIVNLTILVAAHTTVVIPVSCVEQGRWRQKSVGLEAAGRTLFASARARKARDVTRSLRERGAAHTDQGAVWDDVARRLTGLGVASPTDALSDGYDRHAPGVEAYVERFGPAERQVGAVFAMHGRAVGLELFGDPTGFGLSLPMLVRGYALELLDRAQPEQQDATDVAGAEALIAAVAAAAATSHAAVGAGTSLRFDEGGVSGGALAVGQRLVHLTAFVS